MFNKIKNLTKAALIAAAAYALPAQAQVTDNQSSLELIEAHEMPYANFDADKNKALADSIEKYFCADHIDKNNVAVSRVSSYYNPETMTLSDSVILYGRTYFDMDVGQTTVDILANLKAEGNVADQLREKYGLLESNETPAGKTLSQKEVLAQASFNFDSEDSTYQLPFRIMDVSFKNNQYVVDFVSMIGSKERPAVYDDPQNILFFHPDSATSNVTDLESLTRGELIYFRKDTTEEDSSKEKRTGWFTGGAAHYNTNLGGLAHVGYLGKNIGLSLVGGHIPSSQTTSLTETLETGEVPPNLTYDITQDKTSTQSSMFDIGLGIPFNLHKSWFVTPYATLRVNNNHEQTVDWQTDYQNGVQIDRRQVGAESEVSQYVSGGQVGLQNNIFLNDNWSINVTPTYDLQTNQFGGALGVTYHFTGGKK